MIRFLLIAPFIALTLNIFCGETATAQTLGYAEAADRLSAACGADIQKHCKGVNLGGGRIRNCLAQNAAKISGQCQAAQAEVFAMIEKRADAQASIMKVCDTDIRRLCPGVAAEDGNLLECGLKAQRAVSPKCNQALTNAGWR